ncbi:MAG: phosphoribosylglycinamide formyltransferase [Candidatus Marinimicrobia bacterium]|jgi:formyltetrahydrofolate-dependent phosphoribosylglycinamide formyltransferase|nr:phosphoribosylglycinamide formyltransferase [Candidatus Neomarinimicrobiota bacterium]MBT3618464.1 phosphoribosylglycinamide formyltransferase [Candidatus Neomarinimicrobiota bacterium]MBT3829031.1 phosphoribosylglycinamide formyltransferase [Candidatus Neomarinimicrobiota bacterium]MBT3997484.1 phosphoribosylglycinamide formyltransferase [Candidatus Neomarinimicrobiota bacterium]MBT4281430.1 phosphoribosylglycinamide formyltransferase [Candidatus Neomarinimicrobiota bacterium]
MIKLGVIGSTNGTDLQAILDAIASGELDSDVSVVLSNRKNAYILERAENHSVPAVFISHKDKSRETFDAEMTAILKSHNVELVLLIGFMRILSTEFCQEWRDKLLNVHPSLLPKYAGGMDTNVHEEVLKNGETETGCTIHFVTDDVDGGPILVQKKCNVDSDDTIETLKTKVQELEGQAFIEAIKMISHKDTNTQSIK